MKLKKVSEFIIGGRLEKDIHIHDNQLLLKKGTHLDEGHILLLKNLNIETVLVAIDEVEEALYFQIEQFIPKSTQPLFWEVYLELLSDTKRFFSAIANNNYIQPNKILRKLQEMLSFFKDEKEFFTLSYSVQGEEDSIYRHSINVAILCFIAARLDTSKEDPFTLAKMGYFHDVGKMKIDKEILDKKVSLSVNEIEYIRKHTELGAEIIRHLKIDSKEAQQAALLHHESPRGNGYPFGYRNNEIPFSVQIVTMADTFDSICSDRVYKHKKSIFGAFNELFEETVDGKLNPLISFPFIERIFGLFEKEQIILNSGETGTIFHYNPDNIIRPIIELHNGTFLDLDKHREKIVVDFFKE